MAELLVVQIRGAGLQHTPIICTLSSVFCHPVQECTIVPNLYLVPFDRILEKDGKMDREESTELNPPKDTLSTNNTDGWIEEGGSISEEVKIIEQRLLTPTAETKMI